MKEGRHIDLGGDEFERQVKIEGLHAETFIRFLVDTILAGCTALRVLLEKESFVDIVT